MKQKPNAIIFRVKDGENGAKHFAIIPFIDGDLSDEGAIFCVDPGDTYEQLDFSELVLAVSGEDRKESAELMRMSIFNGEYRVVLTDMPLPILQVIACKVRDFYLNG